jgi:hypothetical protein
MLRLSTGMVNGYALFSSTAQLPSPTSTSTCPATAGVFIATLAGGFYSSSNFCTKPSCMNESIPRLVMSLVRVRLLPTYSMSAPSHSHVNASLRSLWAYSTSDGSLRIMTPLTQATSTTNASSIHANTGTDRPLIVCTSFS